MSAELNTEAGAKNYLPEKEEVRMSLAEDQHGKMSTPGEHSDAK